MKTKSESITLKNLNPVFTKPLQDFDRFHRGMTGNQAVVTSTNGGKHWGSMEEEDRPFGWQDADEGMVRTVSDSLHYEDKALDFRRRCPDGEKEYFDDLTEPEQRYFRVEIYKYFPDDRFDIIFSRLCIHVEWDPKYIFAKSKAKVRKKQPVDYEIKPAAADFELPVPVFKRNGFKRKAGAFIGILGGICCLIPHPAVQAIGQGIVALGGATAVVGAGHGMIKNRQKKETTLIDLIPILKWIADLLIKLFIKNKEK